jgi:heme a synthase
MEIMEPRHLASPASGVAAQSRQRAGNARVVATWLLACCAMLFAMIVVGGVTRLTHSGLSITEWQPIVGTLPPLSVADWNEAFAKYQATPEYAEVNRGMLLEQFKNIFWWEYFHRLLGRVIGVVFLVPLVGFALRGMIPPGYAPRLFTIFVLGGLQGALGWYMVQSGLVDDPRVSQLRLTAHLGLAVLIFGAMFWTALSLLRPRPQRAVLGGLAWHAVGLVALVFLMILSGGLVAGIRAGFAYNTFPFMNGHLMPSEIMAIEPWYRNFDSNMATVQFDHRLIALLLAISIPWYWWRTRRTDAPAAGARRAATLLLAVLGIQIALGVSTLLFVVPLPLAAAHQAGAVLLFAAALNAAHAAFADNAVRAARKGL